MLARWLAALVFSLTAVLSLATLAGAGASVIGQPSPEWHLTNWLNSSPIALKDLRGKVVLVRWWTAPGCRYCRATAPALREFHSRYQEEGLRVIGVYHHKSDDPLNLRDVKRHAERLGFKFPVAVDPDWRTLKEWWLDKSGRDWTSVTFLIDRQGVVRHVHPGGAYEKGDQAYEELRQAIETALEKRSPD